MIEEVVRDRSRDRSHLFVFPSEVAADFWRRWLVTETEQRGVEQGRFHSWDSFKERFIPRESDLRPVNRIIRRLFAADLQTKSPDLLGALAPQGAVSASFVASLLPELPKLLHSRAFDSLPAPLASGYRTLHGRYGTFLREHGYFEPSWVEPEPREISGGVTLFFPELIEDYPEYETALRKVAGLSAVSAEEMGEARVMRREEFGHVAGELRALMIRLDKLLLDGVRPGEIALTVASLDSLRPELRSLASAYGVPLRDRAGLALPALPGGRFFTLLDELYRSAYHPDAMGSLLLDRGLPWKERSVARRLVSRGREARCVAADRRAGRARWLRALRGREDLQSLFKRIATLSERLIDAPSFAELQQRLYEFIGALFDDLLWSERGEAVFQRATVLVGRLVGMERNLALSVSSPWTHFLSFLEEEIYVLQDPREGISVYPYRVSAGIRPKYHFVVNATHGETRVTREPLSFLREDFRERFEEEPRDLTDAFLGAYSRSGSEVLLSHSGVNQGGAQIPPAYFMGKGGEAARRGSLELLRREDPYFLEEGYFRGEVTLPEVGRLYRRQQAGSLWLAKQREGRRGVDFRSQKVESETLRSALLGEEPVVSLSHTGVQSYLTSPFGYLLQRLLRIEELDLDPQEASALVVGSFYHELLKELNLELRNQEILVRKENEEQVASLLAMAAESVGERYRRTELGVPGPVMTFLIRRAAPLLLRALRREMESLPPYRVTHVEQSFEEEMDGFRIVGRIDRLAATEEGAYTIVDYKKGSLPAAREIAPDKSGTLAGLRSLQLPMYLWATEKQLGRSGELTEELYYLSVEKGELRFLRSERPGSRPSLSGQRFYDFLDSGRRILSELAARIREGDFRCDERDPDCEGCPFRGICRSRFSVRSRDE
ncbi:MAG: PD-(D/E)XK nuclease family protein [Spirochaetaceae bacterium]